MSARPRRVLHAGLLSTYALFAALAEPGAAVGLGALALLALLADALLPRPWREPALPLLLALGTAAAALALPAHAAGLLLLGLAALALLPARSGTLPWFAAVLGLDLVRWQLAAPAAAAALALPALAILALALAAWEGAAGRRWPWARLAGPSLLAVALGTAAGLAALPRPAPHIEPLADLGHTAARPPAAAQPSSPIPPRLDARRPAPSDPGVVARLRDAPPGRVYLRRAACSRLERDAEGRWSWVPALGDAEEAPAPPPPGVALGTLELAGRIGDAVLVPDDGDWVDLAPLWRDGDGNRWWAGPGARPRRYRVALNGATRREPDPERQRAACRELPPALAAWPWERIADPAWAALPPAEALTAIGAWLAEHARYDPAPPPAEEPFAAFLFGGRESRRGACEHFAAAAALLLRRAGHPARVVVGYASDEHGPEGLTVRMRHAHAWVEVLDAEGVWRRGDPTPPPVAEPAPEAAPAARPAPSAPAGSAALRGALAALAVLALLAAAILRWWWRRPAPAARAAARRGGELLALAAQAGVRVRPGDTAATICRRISDRTGLDLGPALAAYEAARFGGGPPPPPWPPLTAWPRRGEAPAPAPPPGCRR